MLLHGGIFADTACGSMRLFVVWRIVERMGRRHRLAADTACAGMRAVVVGVEILEIGRAVVLRDVGRFGVAAVGADTTFVKMMRFDAGHCITAGAGPLVTGFIQRRCLGLTSTGIAVLGKAVRAAPCAVQQRILVTGFRLRNRLFAADADTPMAAFILMPAAEIRLMSCGGDGFFLRRAAVFTGQRQRNVFFAFGLCRGGRPAVIARILCAAVLAGTDVLGFVFRVCGIAAEFMGLCLADLFSVFIIADLDAAAVAEVLPMAVGVRGNSASGRTRCRHRFHPSASGRCD